MPELLKSIMVCREATLEPYTNIALNIELYVEGYKVYYQISVSGLSHPCFWIFLLYCFGLEEILYILTSNMKDHSLMGAEEELSLLFPKQRKVIVFPVSVPAIVQKIFGICLVLNIF